MRAFWTPLHPIPINFCMWPKLLPNPILIFVSNLNNQLWLIYKGVCQGCPKSHHYMEVSAEAILALLKKFRMNFTIFWKNSACFTIFLKSFRMCKMCKKPYFRHYIHARVPTGGPNLAKRLRIGSEKGPWLRIGSVLAPKKPLGFEIRVGTLGRLFYLVPQLKNTTLHLNG